MGEKRIPKKILHTKWRENDQGENREPHENAGGLCTAHSIISLSSLSLEIDMPLRTSGIWLGTWRGAGGTTTLAKSFFGQSL